MRGIAPLCVLAATVEAGEIFRGGEQHVRPGEPCGDVGEEAEEPCGGGEGDVAAQMGQPVDFVEPEEVEGVSQRYAARINEIIPASGVVAPIRFGHGQDSAHHGGPNLSRRLNDKQWRHLKHREARNAAGALDRLDCGGERSEVQHMDALRSGVKACEQRLVYEAVATQSFARFNCGDPVPVGERTPSGFQDRQ